MFLDRVTGKTFCSSECFSSFIDGGVKEMTQSYYFHGSIHKIQEKKISPRPSAVVDQDNVVFATNSRGIAVSFIPKWGDHELSFGTLNGHIYMMELQPGQFERFKKTSGYLYTVPSDTFISDDRLGMQNREFISYDDVPIISMEKIDNVYMELVQSNINLITFDQMLDAIEPYLVK